MWSKLRVGVGGARHGGGLFVMVGSGARGGMAARAPMLVKAAVMVAAVILAIAALMVIFDMGIPGIVGSPIGPMLGIFGMLGIPMPIGRGKGKGKERGAGDGVGRGSWRIAFGRRLSGIGTPAFAHMAAALALAISSNWSLSSSVSRGGVLLVLRRVRDPDRRCLRRMRTGEWLGSLFHLSRLSNDRLRNTGRLPRPLDRDLRRRSDERDLDRRLLSPDLDLFLLPVERLLDLLFLSVDLDLLRPFCERDRLLRVGERDLDLRALVRDLERERLLRRAAERDLDLLRRPGLRDLERRFFFSDGEIDSLFLTGDLDLDCFLFDVDLDAERRGEEVERESFLRSAGERDFESCFFSTSGEAECEELLWLLEATSTGVSSSSPEPSEPSDFSGPVCFSCTGETETDCFSCTGETDCCSCAGETETDCCSCTGETEKDCCSCTGETDRDLEAAFSLERVVCSIWLLPWLGSSCSSNCSEELSTGQEMGTEAMGLHTPIGPESLPFSSAACSIFGGEGIFSSTAGGGMDLAGDGL